MRWLKLCLVVGLLLAIGSTVVANTVTFIFDPDDLIQLYSTTPLPVNGETLPNGKYSHFKYEQDYPRRVHESWGSVMYNTFGSTNEGETDEESQAAYIAWRNSLDTPDEGIAWFNIWLRDNKNAWNWGERLVSHPDIMPVGTAASGWQVETIKDPWGAGSGYLVQWWTERTDNLINLVNNLDPFSFTVDVREISNPGETYAEGKDIALGTKWDIWFGTYGGIYNDDQPYKSWNYYEDGPIGGWEGTLELTAVPEPLTMFGVLIGLAGLAGYVRKRKKV